MRLREIERIGARVYPGGKQSLASPRKDKQYFALPGGSGLIYSIKDSQSLPEIKIWNPEGTVLIGELDLAPVYGFPLKGALQVQSITVDEDYRGQNIAKSLYGIVLSIMRRPLVAGDQQTPGGRAMWVSLSQIPGVAVQGYIAIDDTSFAADPEDFQTYMDDPNRYNPSGQVDKTIDTIMGRLGGQYIGSSRNTGTRYFAFDVVPNRSGRELRAAVRQNLAQVYDTEDSDITTGLFAVWRGQA
jgi:hypothetical protein